MHKPKQGDLFRMLKEVPGVRKVEWHSSKTSQGNVGDHYSENNILVYSELGGNRSIEFELTRNNHMQNSTVPFTVTTCFKAPPRELIPEAWRILRAVTDGLELFPQKVKEYEEICLARWCGGRAPGSASDPIRCFCHEAVCRGEHGPVCRRRCGQGSRDVKPSCPGRPCPGSRQCFRRARFF